MEGFYPMGHITVIGVMADSHDHLPSIHKAVSLFNKHQVDMVIHAGDIVSPFTSREFERLKSPFVGIFGNNDGDKVHLRSFFHSIGELHSDPFISNLGGCSIAVTHTPEIVESLAHTHDIILYGHTHKQDLTHEPALILNPGECCGYLSGYHTVALLYPEQMRADIIAL
jgi:putative phosphoesterase